MHQLPPAHFRTTDRPVLLGAIAASIASLCFGGAVVATRFVVGELSPLSVASVRYLIGALCLLPVLWRVPFASMPRRDLIAIGGLGVLFFGVFPWSFSEALSYLPAARGAVVLSMTPALTLVLARARGVETITPMRLIGHTLAVGGLALALSASIIAAGSPAGGRLSGSQSIGDALMAVTALTGAIYNVYSRPYLTKYHALPVTAMAMAAGAIGFSLWMWALRRSTPSRVAIFITLNPVAATALSALLLHERVSARFVLGLAVVVSGIVLANQGRRE